MGVCAPLLLSGRYTVRYNRAESLARVDTRYLSIGLTPKSRPEYKTWIVRKQFRRIHRSLFQRRQLRGRADVSKGPYIGVWCRLLGSALEATERLQDRCNILPFRRAGLQPQVWVVVLRRLPRYCGLFRRFTDESITNLVASCNF